MDSTLQSLLLQLFQQVGDVPASIPEILLGDYQQDSPQGQLLTGFRTMLERIEQNRRAQQEKLNADITNRKLAEERLREKEEQYRSIFEATTDAISIIEVESGRVVEANASACRIYGYTYEEMLQTHAHDVIHPDKLDNYLKRAVPAILAGQPFYARGVNLRKDGTAFPVDVRETTFLYQGKPHLLALVRDITEQIQAEEQLREKEAQYRSIFEFSADGLVINDLDDGHVVEANPAMCRMHGYSYEEFMALSPTTFIHPDYHATFEHFLETVKTGHLFQSKALDVRKDGSSFLVEVYGTTFTYKERPHVLSVVRDITKQAEVEEQLREKEAQYRSIFEATSDGLIISSLEDGSTVEANPAICQMFGYTYEEFLALPPAEILYFAWHNLGQDTLKAIREGTQFDTQATVTGKDDQPFHIEAHVSMFIYKGKPHMLSVVRNVTEQVQAQQLLEQRVSERTQELSTLLEISHKVASTIELQPLLGLVLDQLKTVVDYCCAAISTLENDTLIIVESRCLLALTEPMPARWPFARMPAIRERLNAHQPISGGDLLAETPLAREISAWFGNALAPCCSSSISWMVVPLIRKERLFGVLTLFSNTPDYYTARHTALAVAIAQQTTIAMENARLYGRAQEIAALEERQRLARELHDSVSQALYGISLGAHTARSQLSRNPARVVEPLDYVLAQAEAALTEMRALIFELRPESLANEGLVAALTRQGNALRVRHGLAAVVQLGDEPDVPLSFKQELYRLVQEALHNTVKHAQARNVELSLRCTNQELGLEVRDDGVGFDTTQTFPGHLGLHSMRERIARLGGKIEIESAPQQGTRIYVRLPLV